MKEGQKKEAKEERIQLLAINPRSGGVYFRNSNGDVAFGNCFDSTIERFLTQDEEREEVGAAIVGEGFWDSRLDTDFSFVSLDDLWVAVAELVEEFRQSERALFGSGDPVAV